VFSTFLYTGTSASQTITNNIDLSTKGGLVWLKGRVGTYGTSNHRLFDTSRGAGISLLSNLTSGNSDISGFSLSSFNSNGFSLEGSLTDVNLSPDTYASWTFRKQPKFFDIVTFSTNASGGGTFTHNLGSTPGFIIVKSSSNADQWTIYHRSLGTSGYMYLNTTAANNPIAGFWSVSSTSVTFADGYGPANASMVAYLFAHDAGGFGLTGTDNVISCGSYTGNSSSTGPVVTLGYEPQWLMVKDASSTNDWFIIDNMRGLLSETAGAAILYPNLSSAEFVSGANIVTPTATGFKITTTSDAFNFSGRTYIYIAIRRGPMKVPTSGTSVFYPNAIAQANTIDSTGVPFPPDLVNTFSRNGTDRTSQYNQFQFVDRLRGLGTPSDTLSGGGGPSLLSASTAAEASAFSYVQLKADSQNITRAGGWGSAAYGDWINYFFRRAPSFFDEVCYTGNGGINNIQNHALASSIGMLIVKRRDSAGNWSVFAQESGGNYSYWNSSGTGTGQGLNGTGAATGTNYSGFNTYLTSASFNAAQIAGSNDINANGATYVAYLFATCAGVSKVGSYTGTATTKQIDCGFTGGARFVLIKRTDSTGDWYVWDSARGIVSGNDPYLLLNTTAAEVTNTDYIDTYSAGFEISSTAPAAINASGGSFIFFAVS
jgi:hypothetical protein